MAKARNSLPNNNEAEKAVLGSMLLSPQAVVDGLGSLSIEEFFDGNYANRTVFKAMRQLQDKHIPIDVQTVTEELINSKELDSIGGTDYLLELSQSAISLSNLEFYIKIIKDQAVLRNLLLTIRQIDEEYLEKQIEDITDFVSDAEVRVRKVTERRRISNFIGSDELAERVRESINLQAKKATEDGVTGMNTGYTKLNALTQGFQKDNLIIVAARPGMGKTAFALNVAFNVSLKNNLPVAIFSLEMSSDSLAKRLVANRACVPLEDISRGFLPPKSRVAIEEAINVISRSTIFIDDTPGIKLNDIIAKSRKLHNTHGELGLIIIDYIGLITSGSKKFESRQQEVSEISRSLKDLARELKVPVIAVSQLSREVEKRDDKRPQLSDLRESGSIEQDADLVLLLFRRDYYEDMGVKLGARRRRFSQDGQPEEKTKEDKIRELDAKLPGDASLVEIAIAKNRNGKVGMVPLHFFKSYGRFDNPTREYEEDLARIEAEDGGSA
ncbi:MAG: replicative DNA helicase [Bacilli bacterium]|jgi:replicative DNA helicase|nr:replicative DNA helicase [Bacilli bacterium]HOC80271.1 replicative DNA helicase [Bacilli bacterium]